MTKEEGFILAYNAYINGEGEKAMSYARQLVDAFSDYHLARLFLAELELAEGNISSGLARLEELVVENLSEDKEDEILEIVEELILYPGLNLTSTYPELARLARQKGIRML